MSSPVEISGVVNSRASVGGASPELVTIGRFGGLDRNAAIAEVAARPEEVVISVVENGRAVEPPKVSGGCGPGGCAGCNACKLAEASKNISLEENRRIQSESAAEGLSILFGANPAAALAGIQAVTAASALVSPGVTAEIGKLAEATQGKDRAEAPQSPQQSKVVAEQAAVKSVETKVTVAAKAERSESSPVSRAAARVATNEPKAAERVTRVAGGIERGSALAKVERTVEFGRSALSASLVVEPRAATRNAIIRSPSTGSAAQTGGIPKVEAKVSTAAPVNTEKRNSPVFQAVSNRAAAPRSGAGSGAARVYSPGNRVVETRVQRQPVRGTPVLKSAESAIELRLKAGLAQGASRRIDKQISAAPLAKEGRVERIASKPETKALNAGAASVPLRGLARARTELSTRFKTELKLITDLLRSRSNRSAESRAAQPRLARGATKEIATALKRISELRGVSRSVAVKAEAARRQIGGLATALKMAKGQPEQRRALRAILRATILEIKRQLKAELRAGTFVEGRTGRSAIRVRVREAAMRSPKPRVRRKSVESRDGGEPAGRLATQRRLSRGLMRGRALVRRRNRKRTQRDEISDFEITSEINGELLADGVATGVTEKQPRTTSHERSPSINASQMASVPREAGETKLVSALAGGPKAELDIDIVKIDDDDVLPRQGFLLR